ncbi:unnamed protein product [Closterium sp. NIES-53]
MARSFLMLPFLPSLPRTDYEGEQQMEVEALEAILMDEFERVDDTSGLGMPVDKPCYLITISPKVMWCAGF